MATMVTRLYADLADAESAVEVLKTQGFGTLDYKVLAPPQEGDLEPALRSYGVTNSTIPAYVREMTAGRTLLVVRAPFGRAAVADQVLDMHNPVKPGNVVETVYRRSYKRKPLPLTGVTFVTGGDIGTYPLFERITKIDSLTKKQKSTTKLRPGPVMPFIPLLTKSQRSKTKLLTDNTTPFSSMLSLRLLIPHLSNTKVW